MSTYFTWKLNEDKTLSLLSTSLPKPRALGTLQILNIYGEYMNYLNKFLKLCFVNKESNIFLVFVLYMEHNTFAFLLPGFGQLLILELKSFTQ